MEVDDFFGPNIITNFGERTDVGDVDDGVGVLAVEDAEVEVLTLSLCLAEESGESKARLQTAGSVAVEAEGEELPLLMAEGGGKEMVATLLDLFWRGETRVVLSVVES